MKKTVLILVSVLVFNFVSAQQSKGLTTESKVISDIEKVENILDKKGFVIDKSGKEIKGEITIFFESPHEDTFGGGGTMVSIGGESFGKTVKIKFVNEKGKKDKEKFKSKDGTKFCIETADGNSCFLGLKASGNTVNKVSDALSLGFDSSLFYKILHENNDFYLLYDFKDKMTVIKVASQDDGLYITDELGAVKTQKIKEYIICESVNVEDFNLTTIEGMSLFIDALATNCK